MECHCCGSDGVFGVGAVEGEEGVESRDALVRCEFCDGGAEGDDDAGDVVAVVEGVAWFGGLARLGLVG